MSGAWEDLGGRVPEPIAPDDSTEAFERPPGADVIHLKDWTGVATGTTPEGHPQAPRLGGGPGPTPGGRKALARARQALDAPPSPQARETAHTKAMRLLTEGHVYIVLTDHERTVARVRGDHGVYDVERTPERWHCTCPELRGHCSHIAAVRSVTTC